MAYRAYPRDVHEEQWFGELPDRDALIYLGIVNALADDQGRLADNPVVIRSRLFPYRDVPAADVVAAIDRCVGAGQLLRYEDGGQRLLQVVDWWKRQKPQWATRSPLPAPAGWQDRVRTRQNGQYLEEGWSAPGGFTCDVQVNSSGEAVQVNASGEPFGLAREPEPVSEPVPSFEGPGPVDNSAAGPSPSSSKRKRSNSNKVPTCDGKPCQVRDLKCGIRSDITAVAGVEGTSLYGGKSDLSRTMHRYAAAVCQLCQEQLPTVERPDRDELCARIMRSCVSRIVDAHRGEAGPIQNLPAYLNGELKRCTHLGDLCGDELLIEIRREVAGMARPEAEPADVGAGDERRAEQPERFGGVDLRGLIPDAADAS
jgi:hypothetical protein